MRETIIANGMYRNKILNIQAIMYFQKFITSFLSISLILIMANASVVEARSKKMPQAWIKKVERMKANGEDIEIIKSENMMPENSTAEFWSAFAKEVQNPKFNFSMFVNKVTRGFIIERQYTFSGIDRSLKQGLNKNYYVEKKYYGGIGLHDVIFFNTKQFCLSSKWVEKMCVESKKCGIGDRKIAATYYVSGQSRRIEFHYDKDNIDCVRLMVFNEFVRLRV